MINKNDKKTVLVTGGVGFIGSVVVKNLIDNYDCNLVVADNLSVGELQNLGEYQKKISFYNVDIRAKEDLDPIIQKCNYVIHLAANVSIQKSIQDPSYSSSINIGGFLNVLELCNKYKIEKLVYASSAAVYGSLEGVANEKMLLAPESPYGFEKSANDFYAKLYHKQHGLNYVGLRYFNVYGPLNNKASDYAGVVKIFSERISQGEDIVIYGDGSQERDFIIVDDVADITVKTLFSDANGVFNVATGKSVTILELANILQELIGKKVKINFLPKKEGDILKSCADINKLKSALPNLKTTDVYSGLKKIISN